MAENVPDLIKHIHLKIHKVLWTSKWKKLNDKSCTYNNLLKSKIKEKNLETNLKKWHIPYRENGDLNDCRFILGNYGGQKTLNAISEVLKEKNCQHVILYPANIMPFSGIEKFSRGICWQKICSKGNAKESFSSNTRRKRGTPRMKGKHKKYEEKYRLFSSS